MADRYDDLSEYNWLMAEVEKHETEQSQALGKLLLDKLRPASVVDVGCGPGIYLLPFKDAGHRVYGVDGAPAAGRHLGEGEFELVDLRETWVHNQTYDLALCIETAEHLKPEYAGQLVGLLCSLAPTVYFSAARPGQGGEGHYCERPKEFWLALFAAYGFGIHPLSAEIQAVIEVDPVYAHCHWLRWNGMLLGKT